MRKGLVAVLVVAAIGGAYALFVSRSDADEVGGPVAMSSPLPALEGESVSGGRVDFADLRGHVAVVNVWATWCAPCRAEQPGLVRAADRYADQGVRFVGLNYQDNRAAARAWVDEFDVPYESLYDEEGRYADDLGFPYLPDTYVVDADGTIRWVVFGETSEEELSGLIEDVLAQQGP